VSFESILRGLTGSNVTFVVVGGVAAAAHGATRLTNDIDICYDAMDPENVSALGELLHKWKAYPRGVDRGLPFIMDGKTLRAAPMLTLTSTEGDVDVMDRISGIGDYKSVRAHSEKITAFGVEFRIIDLPTLIKAKRAAGRPRDFEHLPELEALLALKKKTTK
jgi:predicted nucleotidyltransferase